MSLYSDWMAFAQAQRPQHEQQAFWKDYFDAEKDNYVKILARIEEPYVGKLEELAEEFDMENIVFVGFIDGINTSLKAGEYDLESLEESSEVSLEVDTGQLYYNMLDAKADWLYNLPEWDPILTEEKRAEISRRFRTDKVYIAEKTPGRNEPCPCGSGKKYKACCGKAV